jgi:hypothetical protein
MYNTWFNIRVCFWGPSAIAKCENFHKHKNCMLHFTYEHKHNAYTVQWGANNLKDWLNQYEFPGVSFMERLAKLIEFEC